MKTPLLFFSLFLTSVLAQTPREQYDAICPSKNGTVELIDGHNIKYLCDMGPSGKTYYKQTKTLTLTKCVELCNADELCYGSTWLYRQQRCSLSDYEGSRYAPAPAGNVFMVQEDKKPESCEGTESALTECEASQKECNDQLGQCQGDKEVLQKKCDDERKEAEAQKESSQREIDRLNQAEKECSDAKEAAEAQNAALQEKVDSLTAQLKQCREDNPLNKKTAKCPEDNFELRRVNKIKFLIRCNHSDKFKGYKQVGNTKSLYECMELCSTDNRCAAVDRSKTGVCVLKNDGNKESDIKPDTEWDTAYVPK